MFDVVRTCSKPLGPLRPVPARQQTGRRGRPATAARRHPTEAPCDELRFLPTGPAPPDASPTAPETEDERVTWGTPFSTIGPRRYLRAAHGEDLRLVLRIPASLRAVGDGVLREMVRQLRSAHRAA